MQAVAEVAHGNEERSRLGGDGRLLAFQQSARPALDPVADQWLLGSRVHEPSARPRDRKRDAERPHERRRPRSRGEHDDVGLDHAVVGHDAGDAPVAFHQAARRAMSDDGSTIGSRQRAEAHGQSERIDAMALVEPVGLDHVG